MKRYRWLLPYVIGLCALLVIAPYDYQLDEMLYDPHNLFGLFFERIILIGIVLLVPFCFYGLYRLYGKRFYLCFGLSLIIIVFDTAHYWIDVKAKWWVLILLSLWILLLMQMLLHKISLAYWQRHEHFLTFLLVVFLSTMAVVFGLKQGWGRVRFREMQGDVSLFTPWYVIQGINGHQSFPSAHTATMSMLFCFWFMYYDEHPLRRISNISKGIMILLVGLMMVSRMVMGAHFFSDVIVGFLITYTMIQVWRKVLFREDTYGSKNNRL